MKRVNAGRTENVKLVPDACGIASISGAPFETFSETFSETLSETFCFTFIQLSLHYSFIFADRMCNTRVTFAKRPLGEGQLFSIFGRLSR
jgi:hypothetical protein